MKAEIELLPKHKARTVLLTGSIACLGGGGMMLLWHLHLPQLLHFHASANFSAMSYSAALGFLLSGLGFLFLWREQHRLATALGLLLFCLSGLALQGYLQGNAAILDKFALAMGWIGGQVYPSTLAPQTAVCFGLIGLILVTRLKALLTGICGAFVFGLGLVTATGYLVSWSTIQQWGLLSQMSLTAALSFSLLGAGLVRLSWLEERMIRTREYLLVNQQLATEMQEHKQTEAALAQSELRYQAFLEAIPDVMFRIHTDGTFLDYWVPESSDFGQSSGAFIGMPIQSFMPGSLTRKMQEYLQLALDTQRIQTFEFQWPSGGEMLTLEARVTRSGENEGIFIIRDITEQLRLSEALVQKNKDLEALLYIISHDLHEPMRAIKSFSRILNRRYQDQLDEKGSDLLERIDNATAHLGQLLEDLLQLSRAQRFEPATERISSATIVANVCSRLKDVIKQTQAVITIAPDLPDIQANETWATQAIYNLMTNALKYTKKGQTPEIEIAGYQQVKPGGMVDVGLVVRDRGIGVPPELEEYIFKLFQRAAGRDYEGTGAGLTIVRQVAERHGGNAWVQPRPGGGSEFYITFGVRSLYPTSQHILSSTTASSTTATFLSP